VCLFVTEIRWLAHPLVESNLTRVALEKVWEDPLSLWAKQSPAAGYAAGEFILRISIIFALKHPKLTPISKRPADPG